MNLIDVCFSVVYARTLKMLLYSLYTMHYKFKSKQIGTEVVNMLSPFAYYKVGRSGIIFNDTTKSK